MKVSTMEPYSNQTIVRISVGVKKVREAYTIKHKWYVERLGFHNNFSYTILSPSCNHKS